MSAVPLLWGTDLGIQLCRLIEPVCERHGCWPALTGGLLYRDGPRKDCDVVIYRGANRGAIAQPPLLVDLAKIEGFRFNSETETGWCVKASYLGRPVDLLFPEDPDTRGVLSSAPAATTWVDAIVREWVERVTDAEMLLTWAKVCERRAAKLQTAFPTPELAP